MGLDSPASAEVAVPVVTHEPAYSLSNTCLATVKTSDQAGRHIYLKGDSSMRLSAPKVITWWVAVALGALGLLGHLGIVAALSTYAFWLVTVGLVLLVLGTFLKDL
jgi:hypothetical protein